MWLKTFIEKQIIKHNTSCPFKIASYLDIHVIEWDLHEEIRGYYKYDRRNKYIVINSNLSDEWKRIVCAHELGHALLHPRLNTPFMRKNTLFSIDKVEREANLFAANLLIPDENLFDSYIQMTIFDIASLYSVPVELVELKFKGLF
ncbi:ImmA/IrrE family metallo-endopeptidase [Lysinibacillus sphaericus]|uniref:ImmA/IrrE family metallo-endopeptidase n=1 Tax=Lysinibacillus sphaericus TaxID=1421 RepID=UPI0038059296